ncbi:hypothetical protein BBO99_00008993 [Phytophthora kernoviae]|uniref:START domain-containing protein n=2 Tax=Phytophthora kernoviae TaxID=325452 RepID=A0A421GDP5_9STRA|nr:hypothetical protein G195_009877 [Phytophthora kernoviae 00238/432]KAG2510731.1 hypothetical protein JM18_008876 [Phytophthora kernoviae]KAG2510966.1 hypothetical protein JM16_008322 [Phytophthora kernoviae]RLM97636.1 hypothetical protein BBI17_008331 [Phytophthora kernoviae]RLN74321.1 hypothetical protein BBO99_00008993 [Phytophthora kernoviae]
MDDKDALNEMADVVIDEALGKYQEFRAPPLHGEIDESRWKIIKKRDGITSYLDRIIGNNTTMSRDDAARESVGSMSFSTKLHGVLAVGTIHGTLNDLMYGLHHCTTELMAIKTAYMADKIVDTKVLAEVCAPTPDEPVNSLYLKWSVSEFAPVLLRKVVRPRDFVYMEAVGILKDKKSGERIGYSLLHSLQIPDIRELTDYQIVRGNFSICGLFRQKSPGIIEVYMNGFVDSMGDIHTGVAIPATAEALMSYRKGVYCGQMKKLNWLLKTKKTVMLDRDIEGCAVCSKTVKKLAFLQAHTRRAVRRNLTFCARCMRVAVQTNGLEVASEELRRQNPFEYFELSSNDSGTSASPSNSVLPDNQQEFFG